jgi:hypothetical protein
MKVLMSLGIVITLSLIGGSVEAKAAECEARQRMFHLRSTRSEDLAAVPGSGWIRVWYGGERRHPSYQPAIRTCAFPECGG